MHIVFVCTGNTCRSPMAEGILKAKCEITEGMQKGSPLIINGDNDMLSTINTEEFKVIRFGIEGKNLYMKADDIKFLPDGSEFTAVCENEKQNGSKGIL